MKNMLFAISIAGTMALPLIPVSSYAQLYAGVSGTGEGKVYVYQGGTNWTAISPSLGYSVLDIIWFNGTLYAGTTSEQGGGIGEVWRYNGGTSWTVVGNNMDDAVCALAIYNGQLYAGTAYNGGNLYRYDGGTNFDFVGSVPNFSGIRAMYSSSYGYLQLGEIGSDIFGHYDGINLYYDTNLFRSCVVDFAEYNNELYAATQENADLLVSTNGINWSDVLDYNDTYSLWQLQPFQGQLYLGYDNGVLAYMDSSNAWHGVLTNSNSIISMEASGNTTLYFGTGLEAVGVVVAGASPGYVYAYTGNGAANATLISGPMGDGVQCLYESPPDPLVITPPIGFNACGPVGGPFTLTNGTFTLANTGTSSLDWSLTIDWSPTNISDWLDASPTNGTLEASGTTNVTVSLNFTAYTLPLGVYTATLWFTNLSDNVGQSRQFTLTVTNPPIITCPSNITVTGCPSGIAVNYPAPTVSGGCPPYTITCVPPNGSTLYPGTTNVNCTVVDACGQSDSCSFTVTVLLPPPVNITCPSNITVIGCSNGAVVYYPASVVSGGLPPYNIVYDPSNGSTFYPGITNVNCTVVDACGQSNSCSFTVTVLPPPPVNITCPGDITITTTNPAGAVVNYPDPTVTGGYSPITVVCSPSSGTNFPPGTTTINCSAVDACGQSDSCSFTVTLRYIQIGDVPSFLNTFNNSSSFTFTNLNNANQYPPPYTIRPDGTNSTTFTTFLGVNWTNVVWSTNNSTLCTPGSGSAEFVFSNINSSAVLYTTNYDTITTNRTQAIWTMDLLPSQRATNAHVTAVAFDIMVDTNSAKDSSGGYGVLTVMLNDQPGVSPVGPIHPTNGLVPGSIYAFTNYSEELGNPTGTNNVAGTWEHILITGTNGLPDASHQAGAISGGLVQTNCVAGITWQWYWGGSGLNGNLTCYIDNLVIYTNGYLLKPAMSISNYFGPSGVLKLITTPNATVNEANPDTEKQNVEVIPITNSWVGLSGAGSGPTMTYALTITNYPSPVYSNFQSYIFIAGNATNTSVPTEPNPDWAEADCMYFQIMNNADGSAYAQLLWKVQDPADNDMFYGNNGYYTGFVGSVTCPATNGGPLGTWSMTFANNTNVTLTAPNGTTYVTNIPYSSTDIPIPGAGGFIGHGVINFKLPVGIWIGCEAGLSNNIGQSATYSQFQIISNGVTVFSDNFGGDALNTGNWLVTAEDPSGVTQIPGDATFLLSWTLPNLGYVLTTTTNLTDANSWIGTTVQPFPDNGVTSACVPNDDKAFYRLRYILFH